MARDMRGFLPSVFAPEYDYKRLWLAYLEGDLSTLSNSNFRMLNNQWIYNNCTVTYPVASKQTNKIARICLTEPPKISVDEGKEDNPSQDRINYVYEKNKLFLKLRKSTALMAAAGDVYLKTNTSSELDYPVISVVYPLDSWPKTTIWGEVIEACFIELVKEPTQKGRSRAYFWKVEEHILMEIDGAKRPYIRNRLYKGTASSIGKEVPINSIVETSEIQPLQELKTEKMWYVRMETPILNTKSPYAKTGMSIYADVLPMIDRINLTAQAYMKEIKLKQPKIAVSEDVLFQDKTSKTLKYNYDEDLLITFDYDTSQGGKMIQPIDWSLYFAAYETAHKEQLDQIDEAVGLSTTKQVVGAKTATESEIEQKDTFETKADFQNVLKSGIIELTRIIMDIDNNHFQNGVVEKKTRHNLNAPITVEFMDSIQNDLEQRSEVAKGLYKDKMISLKTALGDIFPDWTDERIEEEIIEIKNENSIVSASTIDFLGMMNEDDDTQEEE